MSYGVVGWELNKDRFKDSMSGATGDQNRAAVFGRRETQEGLDDYQSSKCKEGYPSPRQGRGGSAMETGLSGSMEHAWTNRDWNRLSWND